MRFVVVVLLVSSGAVVAKPKPAMVEFRSVPASPRAIAVALATEKPGKFREQLAWALEGKLREKGAELTDPDTYDTLTSLAFEKIFEDMAAATDVWIWTGDDGPRGDVLVRESVLLAPGRNTTTYAHKVTVTPKGKRIDRGYLNVPCTVKLSVAKSEADWHAHVEGKGWGAWVHPVLVTDGVARVVVSLFSPGKEGSPTPKHERPVWVGFFQQEKDKPETPWAVALFEPATAKEQRYQESNLLPGDPRVKLTDAMKQHVLALRMDDVRMINPARTAFLGREATWFNLGGLTQSPVDEKTVAWLDLYRASDHPLVRAAAVLKSASLGGKVTGAELLDVAAAAKIPTVQADALAALAKLIDASAEPVPDADKQALAKLAGGDDVKVLRDLARVRVAKQVLFFKRGQAGWETIAQPAPPKK